MIVGNTVELRLDDDVALRVDEAPFVVEENPCPTLLEAAGGVEARCDDGAAGAVHKAHFAVFVEIEKIG